MSSKHLKKGDQKPPLIDGKLRLYSMLYCPFAERPRIVLNLKNIPHDIVNINLKDKPEWLFDLHPEGKVPILDTGSRIIIESLDICDYLDEKYPNPPLYPSDKNQVEKDKEYLKQFGKYHAFFYSTLLSKELNFPEFVAKSRELLQEIEDELNQRGGPYFGGKTPQMIDYMLWPWAERLPTLLLVFGQNVPFQENEFPKLLAWFKGMGSQKVIQEITIQPETHFNLVKLYRSRAPVDYDNIQ